MRKTTLCLLMLAASVLYSRQVIAQTDSSAANLDLGKVFLKKEFTQSITIKGEDLEQMPFSSLHEAINAWTYGYYTTSTSFIYVVDGNLLNDVNAYSIQDIEEITLVQNALVQISGANRQQQLVVITTRKGGSGKQGITVAGQSFLTKREKEKGASSETLFYHQYTVSAYKHTDKIQLGASVNYLRNAVPGNKGPGITTYTPTNFDRFRINAWLNAKLGSQNELYIQLNTAPQQGDADISRIAYSLPDMTYVTRYTYDQKLSSFSPVVGLRSSFLKGFSNNISVGYLTAKNKSHNDQAASYVSSTGGLGLGSGFSKSNTTLKTEMVLVRENISYNISLGNWHIEPSANLTFRYQKSSAASTIMQQAVQSTNNPPTISVSENKSWVEGRSYFLTPSVSLSYKNMFNLQGGMFSNLSSTHGKKIKRIFPFVTTTFNVLPADQAHATSVQLFGSYAQTDYFGESGLLLGSSVSGFGVFGYSPIYITSQYPDSSYWNWQVGTRIGFWHNRLSINYNFEKRDYTSEYISSIPGPAQPYYAISYPSYRSSSHHINVNAAVLDTRNLHWRTGLTASNTKTNITFSDPFLQGLNITDVKYWTGGWVNRLSWKQFSAGLDLMYNFFKDPTNFSQKNKVQSLTIQNIYVGYQLALKGTKGLEVYADSRNLAQHTNYQYQLGGNQKYYGLGFKLNL